MKIIIQSNTQQDCLPSFCTVVINDRNKGQDSIKDKLYAWVTEDCVLVYFIGRYKSITHILGIITNSLYSKAQL